MSGVDEVVVRNSAIHGSGAFAGRAFEPGEEIIEYGGDVIDWPEAIRRYEAADAEGGHTFFFDRSDGLVIDGGSNGNAARWINHGCAPNCEAIDYAGQVFIHALLPLAAGDELLLDYQLSYEDPDTAALYACHCGAAECRGTMLADPGPS